MHLQALYRGNGFVGVSGRRNKNINIDEEKLDSVGADIFERGLCLPSDIKMTAKQQDVVIDLIHRCFE